jgi:glutamate carboxypeptidase
LQQLVQIDSGTGDVTGLAAMGAILKTELEHLGANIESVSAVAPAVGDNVVATVTGTGKGHILLIAHMDTVTGSPCDGAICP